MAILIVAVFPSRLSRRTRPSFGFLAPAPRQQRRDQPHALLRHIGLGLSSREHLGPSGRKLDVGPTFMPPQPAQRDRAREGGGVLIRRAASFEERAVDA